jgi:hypothetical protein
MATMILDAASKFNPRPNRMEKKLNFCNPCWSRGVVGLMITVLCAALPLHAQMDRSSDQKLGGGEAANFRFAEPGELTIIVNIVGSVHTPGRYEISRTIDLMDLISLAGGWTEAANLQDVHINRLAGSGDTGVRVDLKLDLSDYQSLSRSYLALQHRDFIYIGTKSGFTMQDALNWVTTAAILTTTYFTIANRSK